MRDLCIGPLRKVIRFVFAGGLLAVALTTLTAQVAPISTPDRGVNPSAKQDPLEYLVSVDDVLELYIVDVPELSRSYRVSPTGSLTIALIPHPVPAAGLTLDELSQAIAKELRERQLVTDPRITIAVKESRIHSVAIAGAVRKPQIYFVMGKTSLLDVLSQAEGVSDDAGSIARITRGDIARRVIGLEKSNETQPTASAEVQTVDLEKLLATGDPSLNVDIYPGDRVTVPAAGVVYVVGAVNKPGGFQLTANRKELTVLQAIALAQDVKSSAVRNKAMIIRRGPQLESRLNIPVPLKDIMTGKVSDVTLQPNDIFFIPDSASKKVLTRGAEAAVQMATGIVIYRP